MLLPQVCRVGRERYRLISRVSGELAQRTSHSRNLLRLNNAAPGAALDTRPSLLARLSLLARSCHKPLRRFALKVVGGVYRETCKCEHSELSDPFNTSQTISESDFSRASSEVHCHARAVLWLTVLVQLNDTDSYDSSQDAKYAKRKQMTTAEVLKESSLRVQASKVGSAKTQSDLLVSKALTDSVRARSAIEVRTARQIAEITQRRTSTEIEAAEALAQATKIKGRSDMLLARKEVDAVRRQVCGAMLSGNGVYRAAGGAGREGGQAQRGARASQDGGGEALVGAGGGGCRADCRAQTGRGAATSDVNPALTVALAGGCRGGQEAR